MTDRFVGDIYPSKYVGRQPRSYSLLTNVVDVTEDWGSGGAVGDASTDDTIAINEAIAAAVALGVVNPTLYFPAAVGGYKVTSTISVPAEISVQMESPIIYSGAADEVCLDIGSVSEASNTNVVLKLNVIRETISSWDDENCIGIRLINANTCDIHIVQASFFTIGVQLIGAGSGANFNTIRLGFILSNWLGVDVTNTDPDTDTAPFNNYGWCNENLFLGGHIAVYSNTKMDHSRYGVRITSINESWTGNNANTFIKPSFELRVPNEPEEAIPILMEHGIYNEFYACRHEKNSPTLARVLNGSTSNIFNTSRGAYTIDCIDDQSNYKDSVFTSRYTLPTLQSKKLVYSSGPLHKKAGRYDNTPYTHIPGLHMASSSSITRFISMVDIDIEANYIVVPNTRGIGGVIDTRQVKRFVVTREVEDDYEGRILLRCFDAGGSSIASSEHNYTSVGTYTSSFGGAYIEGFDNPKDLPIWIEDEVKSMEIIFKGSSSNALRIRSFAIYSLDAYNASFACDYGNVQAPFLDANLAIEIPTGGDWKKGQIFWNIAPAGGEYVGWLCIVSGSPGTWKGFGAIEA